MTELPGGPSQRPTSPGQSSNTTTPGTEAALSLTSCPPATAIAMSSLDPPTYLTSIQNNIRARPISWEGAVRAKTITDEDLKKIKSIDKVRKEQRKQTIESDVDSFVTLLVGGNGSQSIFEAAAKRQDIIHYMLVLLGDMIDGSNANLSRSKAKLTKFQTYLHSHRLSSNTQRPTSLSCRS